MRDDNGSGHVLVDESAYALDTRSPHDPTTIMPVERDAVMKLGGDFARRVGGVWLLISGRFTTGRGERSTDNVIRELLRRAFGYPALDESDLSINVLLNSPGGSLDSAYATALYFSVYTKEFRVFVPSQAKSASTLFAIGSDKVYLSAFGQLGPLDTQIPDPRNPANTVSALDCYQSVDYVTNFGFKTMTSALPQLVDATERRIPVGDLLTTASKFAIDTISPVLRSVTALDFGGWGRSLKIGEQYARMLLRAKAKDGDFARADRIAHQLVYGYTHHRFPIDFYEAERIGLNVAQMEPDLYDEAVGVVDACHGKSFVGFLSDAEVAAAGPATDLGHGHHVGGRRQDHAQADTGVPTGWIDTDGESS